MPLFAILGKFQLANLVKHLSHEFLHSRGVNPQFDCPIGIFTGLWFHTERGVSRCPYNVAIRVIRRLADRLVQVLHCEFRLVRVQVGEPAIAVGWTFLRGNEDGFPVIRYGLLILLEIPIRRLL